MAIKGLEKRVSEHISKFAYGNFEDMLRSCHDFGDGDIIIKVIKDVFTSTDANNNIVAIGYYCGDIDDFDDTVYVYDGEKAEYIFRGDDGKYTKATGEMLEAHREDFDRALRKASFSRSRNH